MGWHELPAAALPPYAARFVLSQSPNLLRLMRSQELEWRKLGRPDLADQLMAGAAQLKLARRAWEDASGVPPGTISAGGRGAAEVDVAEGVSSGTDEISSEEASSMLKLSRRRVGQMVSEKRLSGRKVGSAWVVDRASVVTEVERRSAS